MPRVPPVAGGLNFLQPVGPLRERTREAAPAPVRAPESRPLAPLDADPAPQRPAAPAAPPAAGSAPRTVNGALATSQVVAQEEDADPFGWDEEQDEPAADEPEMPAQPLQPTEAAEPVEPPSPIRTGRAGRAGRVATPAGVSGQPATGRRRGGVVGALRAVAGVDREPVRTAGKRRGAGKDRAPQWLEGLAQTPSAPPATPAAAGPAREERAPSTGRPGRRLRRRSGSMPLPAPSELDVALGPRTKESRRRSVASDIEVMRAPRGFSAALGRTALFVVLAAVALAGVKQVFWNPFFGHSSAPAVSAAESFDKQGASAAATRYATDYLSFSPTSNAAGAAALSADVAADSDAGGTRWWKGSGYLRADTALPGAVRVVDATQALVTVSVRVHVAIPPVKAAAKGPAVPAPVGPAGSAADPGTVPAGWTDLGARWLVLTVPVVMDKAGLATVTGGGAVFTAEAGYVG